MGILSAVVHKEGSPIICMWGMEPIYEMVQILAVWAVETNCLVITIVCNIIGMYRDDATM